MNQVDAHRSKPVLTAGLAYERIIVGGFSQGACLACEFVARNPRRYGGQLAAAR